MPKLHNPNLHRLLLLGTCALIMAVARGAVQVAGAQEAVEAAASAASEEEAASGSPEPLLALPGEEARIVGVPSSELSEEERRVIEESHKRETNRGADIRVMSNYAEGPEREANRQEAVRAAGVEVVP